jgi:hypothetical protein
MQETPFPELVTNRLIKKSPEICGARRFINVFARDCTNLYSESDESSLCLHTLFRKYSLHLKPQFLIYV